MQGYERKRTRKKEFFKSEAYYKCPSGHRDFVAPSALVSNNLFLNELTDDRSVTNFFSSVVSVPDYSWSNFKTLFSPIDLSAVREKLYARRRQRIHSAPSAVNLKLISITIPFPCAPSSECPTQMFRIKQIKPYSATPQYKRDNQFFFLTQNPISYLLNCFHFCP